MKEWIEEYNNRYVDNGLLKKEIDQYMKAYDESKELVRRFKTRNVVNQHHQTKVHEPQLTVYDWAWRDRVGVIVRLKYGLGSK